MKKLFAVILAVAATLGLMMFATAAAKPEPRTDAICDCYPDAPQLDMDPLSGGGSLVRCLKCGEIVSKLEPTNGVCDCSAMYPPALECDPLGGGECRIYCLGCGKQFAPAE